jgi:putative membrane protein
MQLPPVLNFALYFATALALWALMLALYTRLTPYPEFRLVHEGNQAAAWSLAGTALGLALPLASLVARRWLFPDLREAILADRVSVGMLLGALSLGLGVINAASLTY